MHVIHTNSREVFQYLSKFANEIFNDLQTKIEQFKKIKLIQKSEYNFKGELKKYTYRPTKKSGEQRKEKSIFEKELIFVNANHFFLPHKMDDTGVILNILKSLKNNKDIVRYCGTNSKTRRLCKKYAVSIFGKSYNDIIYSVAIEQRFPIVRVLMKAGQLVS